MTKNRRSEIGPTRWLRWLAPGEIVKKGDGIFVTMNQIIPDDAKIIGHAAAWPRTYTRKRGK